MEEKSGALEKIAKSATFVIVGLFISKVLAYIYKIIIARIGTEEFGLFSTGLAIIGIITTISFLGLHEGVVRYIAFFREKKEKERMKGTFILVITITFILSIFIAIILFIFSKEISIRFFHNEDLSMILKILAVAIPLDVGKTIFLNVIKAFEIIKYDIYIKQILENTLKVIVTAILVYFGLSVVGATIAYVFSLLVGFILSAYFLEKKVYPFLKDKIKPVFESKEILTYSLPLLFSGFLIMIFSWTDTLMLGNLRTISDVGIYNVAVSTAKLLYLAPFAISIIFLPIATRLYARGSKKEIKDIYQSTTKWIFGINLLLFGYLSLFSKEILNILFGFDYVSGWLSLIILAGGFLIMYLVNNASYILRVIKRTRLEFSNYAICAILNIILNYIFILKYGLLGAAIATATTSVILGILQLAEVFYLTKLNPFNLKFLNVILAAILTFIPLSLIISKFNIQINLINLLIIGVLSLGIYLLSLFLTKSLDQNDNIILKKVLNKFKLQKMKNEKS